MVQALPFLQAAGSIVQGIGGLQAGNHNRKVAYGQATEEERAGEAQVLMQREEARKAIGTQLASQYSGGMLGGTGSALDALRESQVNAALDAMTIRRDAAMKAKSLRAQGDQARTQGRFALASGLLGAATSVAQQKNDWAQARKGRSD